MPLNRLTEKLIYDKRLLIDNYVLTEPRAWKISKINRMSSAGLANITLAQDMFNGKTDYVEVNEFGNVVGMWADYFESKIEPKEDEEKPNIRGEITFSGMKPELKIGGNYKKFTATFYDGENETDFQYGEWNFYIDEKDASDLVVTLDSNKSDDVKENQIKVKFIGDDEYIGKKLKIVYDSSISIDVEVEIKSL